MKRIDPLTGRFEFKDIGFGKFSDVVALKGESDLASFIRTKIKNPDVDWSYDSVQNFGRIWVKDLEMGTFKKVFGG